MSSTKNSSEIEWLVTGVSIFDGTGSDPFVGHVGIKNGKIAKISQSSDLLGEYDEKIDGHGLALSPGFIDTHAHDDLRLISEAELLCKLTQGVTTVVIGNCGISAAPLRIDQPPIEPINLLGPSDEFRYSTFREYRDALEKAKPSVNVVALVGHTSLRQKFMSDQGGFHRAATAQELENMRFELRRSLADGANGFSTGLAYANAKSAPPEEIHFLMDEVANAKHAVYATHMRSEHDDILEAIDEAFEARRKSNTQLIVSHLKCAEKQNWGKSEGVLAKFQRAVGRNEKVGYDCYPYTAASTIIDLNQVKPEHPIKITWSEKYPEMAGRWLHEIATEWNVPLLDAAQRLQPGQAIYFIMSEEDVARILAHPLSMVGSDGLPNGGVSPHPRLWGTFPRVLKHYCLRERLFPMATAIAKMTALPASRFNLRKRGMIKEGYWADLVLFDPKTIEDRATFDDPTLVAAGIEAVWVNGVLSYRPEEKLGMCLDRNGRFLEREVTQ